MQVSEVSGQVGTRSILNAAPPVKDERELRPLWNIIESMERMPGPATSRHACLQTTEIRRNGRLFQPANPVFIANRGALMRHLENDRSSWNAYEVRLVAIGLGMTPRLDESRCEPAPGSRVALDLEGNGQHATMNGIMLDSGSVLGSDLNIHYLTPGGRNDGHRCVITSVLAGAREEPQYQLPPDLVQLVKSRR
jgi:hypothetical protein